jgi:hypothetical protein
MKLTEQIVLSMPSLVRAGINNQAVNLSAGESNPSAEWRKQRYHSAFSQFDPAPPTKVYFPLPHFWCTLQKAKAELAVFFQVG